MGQRHQIYVRLPKKDLGKGNPNNRDEITIGIHHQWLFGQRAILQLRNFLMYWQRSDTFGREYMSGFCEEALGVVKAAYSFDPMTAYFHHVSELRFEDGHWEPAIEDPRKGDNNDGITIIDLTGPRPKYCFMSVYGLECEEASRAKIKDLEPLTAAQYLKAYYPEYDVPNDDPEVIKFHSLSRAALEFIGSFDVLKLDEVKRMFPKMYQPQQKDDQNDFEQTPEVITRPTSAWPSSDVGKHLLNPTDSELARAIDEAASNGFETVYVYRDKRKHKAKAKPTLQIVE